MLYKWNHIVYNLLELDFSLNVIPLKFIQVIELSVVCSYLLLSSIPLYGHNHSIYSLTEGHLNYFQFLAIENKPVDIQVYF